MWPSVSSSPACRDLRTEVAASRKRGPAGGWLVCGLRHASPPASAPGGAASEGWGPRRCWPAWTPPLRWPAVSRATSRPPVTGTVAGRGPQGDSANGAEGRPGLVSQGSGAHPPPPAWAAPTSCPSLPEDTGSVKAGAPGRQGRTHPPAPRALRRDPGTGRGPGRELVGPGGTRETDEGPGGGGAGRASWGHGRAPWIEVSRFPIDGTHRSPSPRGRETEGGGRPLLRGRVCPPSGAHRLLSKTPSSCRRQSRVWAPEIARLGRRRARAGPGVCSAASARALLSPRSARDTDTSLLWPLTASKRCS